MNRSLNCQEQYSRRTCLLLRGVKGYEKESTDQVIKKIFEKEMQEKLSVYGTDRSHRLASETFQM